MVLDVGAIGAASRWSPTDLEPRDGDGGAAGSRRGDTGGPDGRWQRGGLMSRICTVLARAGSVGLPGKNMRRLGGVPLAMHSVRQARDAGLFDAIAVSSDDPLLLEAARGEGVDAVVERPPDLATAFVSKLPALRHCVDAAERMLRREFEVVVDLQPTSPLRLASDIARAVDLLERDASAQNVVSVSRSRHSPESTLVESGPSGFVRLLRPTSNPSVRRQDQPDIYALNGSIYVWRRGALAAELPVIGDASLVYVMPESRSIDVDTALDWEFVQHLYGRERLWKSDDEGSGSSRDL